MAYSANDDVVAAIAAVLDADTALTALTGGRLYNDAPEDASYPHQVIEYITDKPWHTFGGATAGIGWNIVVRVHTYSLYQGQAEALAISKRTIDALNFTALTVAGWSTVICERIGGMSRTEPNKQKLETRHIVDEFRIRVHQ